MFILVNRAKQMYLNLWSLLGEVLNHILADKIPSDCLSCADSEYSLSIFILFKWHYFQVQLQGQTIWLLLS